MNSNSDINLQNDDPVKLDKSLYDNSWYKPGSFLKRTLWYFTNALFFLNPFFPFRRIKPFILRIFGAKVGKRCIIQPRVNIKYPWFLEIGDYVSIGERVWLDNPSLIRIADQVTISQGSYLISGNHDYRTKDFALILAEIHIEEGAWVGAGSLIGPGVRIEEYAVTTMGTVATKDCEAYWIYKGNPAEKFKIRKLGT